MDYSYIAFCERLNECLKMNNMTQKMLAEKIGMSKTIINNYCTGKREPRLEIFVLICQVLDESADYLLGLED